MEDHELLELALQFFAERGFDGTSVRELCRQLGVSHNLIHQRFGTKLDLWFAAVEHGFETLTYQLMEAVAEVSEGDDLDRLRAVLVRFIEVTTTAPALIQVINQEGTRGGPRLEFIFRHHIGPAMRLVHTMFDRLLAAGRVRPVPEGTFYFLLANGATGPSTLPALAAKFPGAPGTEGQDDRRSYAVSVVDAVLHGIVVDKPSE